MSSKLLLLSQVALQPFNTLAIAAKAQHYLKITDAGVLPNLSAEITALPRFVLGGGSNVVFGQDFEGLVLHIGILGKQLIKEDAEAWYVEAGAGENWHQFVQWTLANGFPGLENLSLIPGTVGAAPIQNIGAYGLEIAELFHHAVAWDFAAQQWCQLDRHACRFAYRDSLFKQEGWHLNGQVVVTQVVFRIPKNRQPNVAYADVAKELGARQIAHPTAQDIADVVIHIRQNKLPDPVITPNAGSFFHNPIVSATKAAELTSKFPGLPCYPQADGSVKLAAGWLIEQAGWKGKSIGPVGMYEKQALVLVNHGNGTGTDVKNTMRAVQEAVLGRFMVRLEAEPVFVP